MVGEALRCLTLLLVIPPGVLLLGPLLLIAAAKGTQRLGPLTLDVRRSGSRGRVTAGLTGFVLWIAVWGGLLWLFWPVAERFNFSYSIASPPMTQALSPTSGSGEVNLTASVTAFATLPPVARLPLADGTTPLVAQSTPPLVSSSVVPSVTAHGSLVSPTFTPLVVSTPSLKLRITPSATGFALPTPTFTMTPTEPPTATSTPTPSATWTPTPTASPSPKPTVTPTESPSPTATVTPTPTETSTPTQMLVRVPSPTPSYTVTASPTPSPTVTATPTADYAREAIATVGVANEALRLAIELPSQERLSTLGEYWKERAFPNVQAFVFSIIKLVGRPVKASYVYLIPPSATYDHLRRRAHVNAIEIWTYEGSKVVYKEEFVFHYVLAQHGTGWAIVDYTYRNVP